MVIQARAQLTRDTIVAGAATVFGNRGYGLSSIADIAAEAGATKGALYFHFSSKDELARAVIEEQHTRTMTAAAEIMQEGRPGLETMVLLSRRLALQILEDPVVQAGIRLTTDVSSFEHPVSEPCRDWLETAEDLFARSVREGDLAPTVDVGELAYVIVAAFTGVQLVSHTLTGRADLLERVRLLWRVLLPGIVVPERLEALRALPDLVVDGEPAIG
ncbi:ScbR family autoregulator-binding transcription factor [Leifsonia sp. AG29]|uniref:ScbR family autoregulator-binding transcription factor n=1 Tax=Leifsonia sp. AG29 TaxID=2598860 RepID=UPI00131BDB31|nr:ScbR family autoregulator-binding transcription factor [Leifsonia sp. AG29]